MLHSYKADLHIHSVLSPCGGLEMSPAALIRRVQDLRIEWMAITDHNSLANCPAYAWQAKQAGIAFTYGVEINTAEEIHLLAYFDREEQALAFDRLLYEALPYVANDPDFFGDQPVIDAQENLIRLEEKALSNSVIWDLETAVRTVEHFGGISVPAHIDRDVNSIISQLGFMPDMPEFPLLSVSAGFDRQAFLQFHPELTGRVFLRASDAHYLTDLGKGCALITVESPNIRELVMAAKHINDRNIDS